MAVFPPIQVRGDILLSAHKKLNIRYIPDVNSHVYRRTRTPLKPTTSGRAIKPMQQKLIFSRKRP